MSEQSTHPSHEDLAAYSCGQLPENKAAVIDDHISKCEPCCETIVGLTSDDTFVGQLQEARRLPVDSTMNQPGGGAESSGEIPASLVEYPRYEILGLIGNGGMGDVYKARHRMMKRDVALKVIKRQLVRRPEALDRFHREVTTAAQLTHPNIVTSYDAEQAGDDHFMVMEYVDGIDLSQIVKEHGALTAANACDYIRQAAIGLQHAHELGMVHRDIKPHNLRVTNEGVVKILDFGLASLAPLPMTEDASGVLADGNLTVAGSIMGTPDFISPEQAQDAHTADVRSDIYSLGMTLYFLLAGRTPFREGTAMDKIRQHAETEPTQLDLLRDDLPEGLNAVVNHMIGKEPGNRFQSHADVADALKPFNEQLVSTSDSTNQPHKPRRVAKICAGLLSIALVAFLVASNLKETVGDKLAKMKAPTEVVSAAPPNTAAALFYTVEGESLDGRHASVCDIGDCRIAVVGWGIETRDFSEGLNLAVSGANAKKQRAIDAADTEFFQSQYVDGEAGCRFHDFKFRLNEELIRFNEIGHVWNTPGTAGLLILVDADTGKLTTQSMTPKSQRISLQGMSRPSAVVAATPSQKPQSSLPLVEGPRPASFRIGDQTAAASGDHTTDYRWEFQGDDVGELTVKIMLAANGKTKVARQLNYRKMEDECRGEIQFSISDETQADDEHTVSTELSVSATGLTSINETERRGVIPATISGAFTKAESAAIVGRLESHKEILLFQQGFWNGDRKERRGLESMIRETRNGGTFVFVTLAWSPFDGDSIAGNTPPRLIPQAGNMSADNVLRRLTQVHGNINQKLGLMLSEAAGVPNGQWDSFARDPAASRKGISGEPLSLMLWSLNPLQESISNMKVLKDFQYIGGMPTLEKLNSAMSPSRSLGYHSMLQPQYLNGLSFRLKAGDLNSVVISGSVRFHVPRIYAGEVEFKAEVNESTDLLITEFQLPNYDIKLIRQADGTWTRDQPGAK